MDFDGLINYLPNLIVDFLMVSIICPDQSIVRVIDNELVLVQLKFEHKILK